MGDGPVLMTTSPLASSRTPLFTVAPA
jgi:hypothetical protein